FLQLAERKAEELRDPRIDARQVGGKETARLELAQPFVNRAGALGRKSAFQVDGQQTLLDVVQHSTHVLVSQRQRRSALTHATLEIFVGGLQLIVKACILESDGGVTRQEFERFDTRSAEGAHCRIVLEVQHTDQLALMNQRHARQRLRLAALNERILAEASVTHGVIENERIEGSGAITHD